MKGKRRKERQQKRWENNNKEWIGIGFASSTWAAEDRTRWKGFFVKSSGVSRRHCKFMGKTRLDQSLKILNNKDGFTF